PKIEALFGPTNHRAYQPWTQEPDHVEVIRSGVVCSPCGYVGHSVGLRHGCEARTCMKLIQPGDIWGVSLPLTPAPSPRKEGKGSKADIRSVFSNNISEREARTPALKILGVAIDSPTFASLLDQLGTWIEEKSPRQICTVNPEFIMEAQRDV